MLAGKRVFVAMSGGVDSSVAAALLLEAGYRVEGLTMRLWHEPAAASSDSAAAAEVVCRFLGIPHRIVDLEELFYEQVVGYFVQEYAAGRTPNPCVRCNRQLKFGALLDDACKHRADYLATGHYARIRRHGDGWRLLCGLDRQKDQSYFLYMLQQEQLGALLFPLGDWTKAQTRAYAVRAGLPAVDRPESQDVCFLADGDYRRFLAERRPELVSPGPILDSTGRKLGCHQGLAFYTVGQRQGLGISAPHPLYVLSLDVPNNALIVGYAQELGHNALLAKEVSYVSGQALPAGASIEAQIRYRARRTSARLWSLPGERAKVVFDASLRDITPGQSVVFCAGEQLLGGGIISCALQEDLQSSDELDTIPGSI